MSLKFALLGLIALEPRSGYDIKRIVDSSIYFIWNVTGPQIYTTLRALREEELITTKTIPQQGKPDKQIHTITPEGLKQLKSVANQPLVASVTRDEILLRIFFGNFARPEIVSQELMAYLERLRSERQFMEATEARVLAHPGARHEARRFQLLSLRLTVARYRAAEIELQKFLDEYESGQAPKQPVAAKKSDKAVGGRKKAPSPRSAKSALKKETLA